MQLDEMPTRKHFQMVADEIKSAPEGERQKLADHHAAIFAKANPRFDHARFHAAVGTRHKEDTLTYSRGIGAGVKHHRVKEDADMDIDENGVEVQDATTVPAPHVAVHAADILAAAAAGKPADAQAAFAQLMADRVADFVATRREELAQTMFGGELPDDDEEIGVEDALPDDEEEIVVDDEEGDDDVQPDDAGEDGEDAEDAS